MEPRSIERGESSALPIDAASGMPLQWSHVQSNVESPPLESQEPQSAGCFNGATFNRTWRAGREQAASKIRDARLQWSHVQSNVERRIQQARIPSQLCFNGATFNRTWRGDIGGVMIYWERFQLQWSHVQSNVERVSTLTKSRPRPKKALQWSHVQSNVER